MRSPCPYGAPIAASTLALVPLLVACTGDGSDSGNAPAFTRTDSAGVTLVVTTYSEPAPEVGWTIDDASQIRYGESGGDEVLFQWVRNAVRLSDGRVVALDGRAADLYVFDADGQLVARAGGEGDGPGELKRPSGLRVLAGDTILVYDAGHMRFSLFDMQGEFLDERRLEPAGSGDDAPHLTMYGMLDAVGDTITLRGEGFTFRAGDGSSGAYTWENPTLSYTTDGTFLASVAEPMKMWFVASNRGPRTELFGGYQNVAAGNGRVFIGDRGRYEVRVYDPPARLLRIERLERPRRPITDELLDRYRQFLSENVEDENDRKRMLKSVDESPHADSMAWIGNMTPDAVGNLWISEYALPEDPGAVGVFSAEGEWLGSMPLPPKFRPLEIGADYILGVFTDELDVPHLVSYDLIREPPAMETAAD